MREDGQRTGNILGKLKNKGPVLLYDDMEGVLKWGNPQVGPAASVRRSGDYAYQGNYGIEVYKRILFPNGVWFYVGRTFIRRSETWAFEASGLFRLPAVRPVYGYSLMLNVRQGGKWRLAGVRWDKIAAEYRYIGVNGSWVVVPGAPPGLSDEGWHRLWFRAEFDRGVYLAAGADSIHFEIGGERHLVTGWPFVEYAEVVLGMYLPGVGSNRMGVDEVLVMESL